MNKLLIPAAFTLLLACFAGLAVPANEASQPLLEVRGEINLVQSKSNQRVHDASQAVVWLVPADRSAQVPDLVDRPHYRMLQHNKTFEPSLLVVPLGSVVDFPNLDPWFHNVFSLYQGKRFDLGLYQAGSQKAVRFDRPGPSFLFCNIHPQMTAVVLTVDSNLFGISNKAGQVSIAHVPSGVYIFHIWHEAADPEALETLQRSVLITQSESTFPAITIPVTKHDPSQHKDKYGNDYDPKAGLPAY